MSRCKRIGDIGEANVLAELLTYNNVFVSKPVGDNCPYDLLIDVNGKIYRAQVKTTQKVSKKTMSFCLCSFNPKKKVKRVYTGKDIDLFIVYCIENKYMGFIWENEVSGQKQLTITTRDKNENIRKNVRKQLRFAEDYALRSRIHELKQQVAGKVSPQAYNLV